MTCSVIVPVLNGKATIGGCIESLLNQTLPRSSYEVIVVDDGSTDGTPDIVRRYGVRLSVGSHRGPAAARNRGVELAEGEIVLFTDADCRPAENWLEEMVSPFDAGDVVAVKGAYRTGQAGLVPRLVQAEFEERYRMLSRFERIDFVDSYSAAFRKGVFLRAGGFDCAFPRADNEDVDLSYRVSRLGGRMVFNPRAVVCHIHPETFFEYFGLKLGRGYWRMLVYSRFPGKAVRDTYTPAYLKFEIAGLLLAALGLAGMPLARLPSLVVSAAGLLIFLASTLPSYMRSYRGFGPAGLIFMFLRAVALAAGSLWGLIVHLISAVRCRNLPRTAGIS
ncbi:MAG: glycosyltransferase [Candidatus Tritonobacter lacicola]|nr:glycosyltransferase [Candidatus Tritonobacter lacicola]